MEPILDETSLVPCSTCTPADRITKLAGVLQALDQLGAARVLRSTREAPDRDIGGSRGLKQWCFDKATPREARQFVAIRLGKPPLIDGNSGLFAKAEGTKAVEAKVGDQQVFGLGLAALTDGIAVALTSASRASASTAHVKLSFLDEGGVRDEQAHVTTYVLAQEITSAREQLRERIERAVPDGATLLSRMSELFPRLRLGERATEQLGKLSGAEPVFRQLIRHLRALDEGALAWGGSGKYSPQGVTYSVESEVTLQHGTYGPQRDFPAPAGFAAARWSLHTKLTGGNGARLYFRAECVECEPVVLIGYFGDHLDTVRFH